MKCNSFLFSGVLFIPDYFMRTFENPAYESCGIRLPHNCNLSSLRKTSCSARPGSCSLFWNSQETFHLLLKVNASGEHPRLLPQANSSHGYVYASYFSLQVFNVKLHHIEATFQKRSICVVMCDRRKCFYSFGQVERAGLYQCRCGSCFFTPGDGN
jgi:hypothetical protein